MPFNFPSLEFSHCSCAKPHDSYENGFRQIGNVIQIIYGAKKASQIEMKSNFHSRCRPCEAFFLFSEGGKSSPKNISFFKFCFNFGRFTHRRENKCFESYFDLWMCSFYLHNVALHPPFNIRGSTYSLSRRASKKTETIISRANRLFNRKKTRF